MFPIKKPDAFFIMKSLTFSLRNIEKSNTSMFVCEPFFDSAFTDT